MAHADSKVTGLDDDVDQAPANVAAKGKVSGPVKTKSTASTLDPNRRVALTIHASSEDGGNDAVFVSVEGFAHLIPRGKPFDVPYSVVGVLKMAVQKKYHTEGRNTIESEVPRYQYSVDELA